MIAVTGIPTTPRNPRYTNHEEFTVVSLCLFVTKVTVCVSGSVGFTLGDTVFDVIVLALMVGALSETQNSNICKGIVSVLFWLIDGSGTFTNHSSLFVPMTSIVTPDNVTTIDYIHFISTTANVQ